MHMHCAHTQSEEDVSATLKNLLISLLFNGALSLFERITFLWGGSIPVEAAYLHDLADAGGALILLVLARGACKAPYLWNVADFLGGVFMITASAMALTHGIDHMRHPVAIKTDGLILLAITNFCANAVLAIRLKEGRSGAEKQSALHFMQDAAMAGAMLLTWTISSAFGFGQAPLLDAFIAVLISGIILAMATLQFLNTIKKIFDGMSNHPEE